MDSDSDSDESFSISSFEFKSTVVKEIHSRDQIFNSLPELEDVHAHYMETPILNFLNPFSIMQLQMLAFISVLIASGLVYLEDLLFVILIIVYLFLLSLFVFPPATPFPPPRILNKNNFILINLNLGFIVGMFFPIIFIFTGFANGNQMAVQSASPHIFLLCCQIFTENFCVHFKSCSLPIRALIPILFNVRRLWTISTWMRLTFDQSKSLSNLTFSSNLLNLSGRFLAVLNMIYWNSNLYFFLIPIFLPTAMKKHFLLQKWATRGQI